MDTAARAPHTPPWAFHGSADANGPTMPIYSVNGVATINACAPDVPAKVALFPGRGHDPSTWNSVYDLTGMTADTDPQHAPYDQSIYTWMLQYSR